MEPPLTVAQKAATKRFSECMRENGVDEFPDPTEAGRIRLPDWKPADQPPGLMDAQSKCQAEPGYAEAFPEPDLDDVKG